MLLNKAIMNLSINKYRNDGTLKDRFRLSCGYYEAKDPKDDLDKEIETAKSSPLFQQKTAAFLEQYRREINPDFSFEDILEILIQHMLTNKLFIAVFNEVEFYKANNKALSIDAIVAFVSNRSFVDTINADGFRAVIGKEFDYLYILDTQSDVRKNPKISWTRIYPDRHNNWLNISVTDYNGPLLCETFCTPL
jgi:predicted helicase